jgi:hypothetical protein
MEVDWAKWPENTEDLRKEEIIELLGGAEALKKSSLDFQRVTERFWQEREALVQKYPRKWVLVSKDGVLTVGDTFDQVWEFALSKGLRRPQVLTEYLDPDPPALIL